MDLEEAILGMTLRTERAKFDFLRDRQILLSQSFAASHD